MPECPPITSIELPTVRNSLYNGSCISIVKFTGTSGMLSSMSSQDKTAKTIKKMLIFDITLINLESFYMITTAKIRKYYLFFFLLLSFLIMQPKLYAQKYSIDKQATTTKTRRPFSFKYLFKKDATKAAARQIKKDDKHKTKVMTKNKENNVTYQKKANNNKETGKEHKVYTRMKKYEKQSKRRRKNKPTKDFFQRLFSKSKRNKPSKS